MRAIGAVRRAAALAVFTITLGAAPGLIAEALAGPYGADERGFQAMYLQASDLPSPSELSGDWAKAGCEGPSSAFGCTFSGKKLWTARDQSAPAWQVHDIRYVFPDASAAQRFVQSKPDELSEGLIAVSQPPAVGEDSAMYTAQGDTYGLGIEVVMYDLVFRVDNVVVKLFVSQGPGLVGKKVLSPLMVAALGQKVVERIRGSGTGVAAPMPVPQPQPQPVPQPVPQPQTQPVPQPIAVEPTPAPTPEPPPEPRQPRRSGRLGQEVKDYWRSKLSKPYIFVGGNYSKALGTYRLSDQALTEKNAFDVAFGALMHPRFYFQVMFHREVWQTPMVQEALVRRLEFIYGLDLLALPPRWRVRPALMLLLGFGFGFGRLESLQGEPDPLMPVPQVPVAERRGVGIGGLVGGDFALHFRLADKFELAPYAGLTVPAYTYTNDFPAADRNIDGERGFGRAVRWHVGLKIGFGGPE